MREENIDKMSFKELRKEVQLLRDELAVFKRKYEDAIYNLDSENFGKSFTVAQNNMKTQIQITADAIKTTVSQDKLVDTLKKYSTTEQTAEAITSTVTAQYVDNLELKNYVTNTTLTSKIEQTSDQILSTVSETTVSKVDLNTTLDRYSTIDQTAKKIESTVEAFDEKLTSYSTITQTAEAINSKVNKDHIMDLVEGEYAASSEITQLSDRISLVVTATDTGAATVNSASIVAAINNDVSGDTSAVKLSANAIDLTAYSKTVEVKDIAEDEALTAAKAVVGGIKLTATDGEKTSTLTMTHDGAEIASAEIKFTGVVTFNDLKKTDGSTVIDGSCIKTGFISSDRIETEGLGCTKIHEVGKENGVYASINSSYGDFGLYSGSVTDPNPRKNGIWGFYNTTGDALNFYVYGDNYLGYNYTQEKAYPKGKWDFSSCTVLNLGVVPVFGE